MKLAALLASLVGCIVAFSVAVPMPVHRMKRFADAPGDEQLLANLQRLAVVRVPDTEEHMAVSEWIQESLKGSKWHVETDTFHESTPHGVKKFSTIIATLNPAATKRLVVAAHYDSKYFAPPTRFVGATDSATCCAILLDLARVMEHSVSPDADPSLQLIFFDGEEAFAEWTATDSLYGARHLAEKWEKEGRLKGIGLFVLLDLVGGKNAAFYSLYQETSDFYERLRAIEGQLRRARSIAPSTPLLFKGQAHGMSRVEDDHVPFLSRGVPVMHLISLPFPSVWHTPADTPENVDTESFLAFNKIVRVAEYCSAKKLIIPSQGGI